jgi:O-antigen/teichoic acid export membrane protein
MTDGRDRELELSSLHSVIRGASLYIGGKLLVNVLEFLLQLIISRHFGANTYGLFAYGRTVANSVMTVTHIGADKALLRYLPEHEEEPSQRSYFFGLACLTSFVGGLGASAAVYLAAPLIARYTLSDPVFVEILRVFAIIILFDTLARLLYATFRSLEKLEYTVLTSQFLRPITRLGAVALAIVLGLSIYGTVVALASASVVVFILTVGVYIFRIDLRPSLRLEEHRRKETVEYYNYSLPLSVKSFGQVLQSRVDILMVGIFLASTSVGIYNAALVVSEVLMIATAGINQLFPPVASRLYTNDNHQELNSVFSIVTRWAFTISLIMAVAAAMYRLEILLLFGPEFTQGSLVLVMFLLGKLFNATAGPGSYVLMMTGHQYAVMINQWVFGLLNVILNYVLIQEFGLIGAVLASAGVLAAMNVARTIEIWYFERLFPYSLKFAKPLVASVPAGLGMVALGEILTGIPLLVLGGLVGVAVYAGTLFLLGIEDDDREFFAEMIG